MKIAVRCNKDTWVYECSKVLSSRQLFGFEGGNIIGLSFKCTDGTVRYIAKLERDVLGNLNFIYDAKDGWEKPYINNIMQAGFLDCTNPNEWSQVVSDFDTFRSVYYK